MIDNKIHHLQTLQQYNIFPNDRPPKLKYNNHHSHNIITHLSQPQHNINPQQNIRFSARKIIPLDTQVIRQRSQMIAHPSKLSPAVPGWFKGQTYKYYQRSNYNQITHKMNHSTLQPTPLNDLVSKHISNRSELGTPRSYSSNDSEVFYLGGYSRREVSKARSAVKKIERQISSKIGATQKRSFELPKIPIKIGHSGYINTHKVW